MGEGFLLQIQKLNRDISTAKNSVKKAEDVLNQLEDKRLTLIIEYNTLIFGQEVVHDGKTE